MVAFCCRDGLVLSWQWRSSSVQCVCVQFSVFSHSCSNLVWTHLENNDFAIISLQIESPGGGDEALGRADDVVAPAGHSLHHRGRLWAQCHGLQLHKEKKRRHWSESIVPGRMMSGLCVTTTLERTGDEDFVRIVRKYIIYTHHVWSRRRQNLTYIYM